MGKQNYVCIAPEKSRTPKYLLAAAAGIPCVKFDWISQCVDNAMAGTPRAPPKMSNADVRVQRGSSSGGIFEGKSFRIIGTESYEEKWKPILKTAGANLLDRTDARRVYTDQSSQ